MRGLGDCWRKGMGVEGAVVEMYDRDGWMDTRIGVWRCGCTVYCMRERSHHGFFEHNCIAEICVNIIIHGNKAQAKSLRMSNLS